MDEKGTSITYSPGDAMKISFLGLLTVQCSQNCQSAIQIRYKDKCNNKQGCITLYTYVYFMCINLFSLYKNFMRRLLKKFKAIPEYPANYLSFVLRVESFSQEVPCKCE